MAAIKKIQDIQDEMTGWRQELHQYPQTNYEEQIASDYIKKKLTEWNIPFTDGWAGGYGIVATIEGKKNTSGKAIGLRADMDALDIDEKTGLPYCSKHAGKMHACGHDGHMAILLGATKYLNETRNFDGKVHLIFQPAEEGGRGADKMIEEGLFDKYPCESVHAVHNWPWLPLGKIGMRVGPIMAAVDTFYITVTGKEGHAAVPQGCIDPIVATSELVLALQSIVSRSVDPTDAAVVSITNFNAGTGAFNIIPREAKLVGTVRTLSPTAHALIQNRFKEICDGVAQIHGVDVDLDYIVESDATVNTAEEIELAAAAAADVIGAENVDTDTTPFMTGEDFGSMLKVLKGTYVYLGQGREDDPKAHNSKPLHHAEYDFNDNALPIGASYMARIIERGVPLDE